MPYDAQGQPLASTLSDYLLPGPTEVPDVRILHMETPSPYTRFGQKGIGEGGAIAPPAAITNAINDALQPASGAELLVSPITPRRIVEAIGCSPHTPDAKMLAGGQTLGPMLNLRLAQPALLVDITRIPELAASRRTPRRHPRRHRHARGDRGRPRAGPDRRLPGAGRRGIAYRAVRTRGTIGGSLAHADPAADWLSCLTALGAEVEIGRRAAARGALRRHASCAAPWRPSWRSTSCRGVRIRDSRERPLRLPQDLPQDRRVRRGDRRRRA